jgi:hypothetical protein
MAAWMKKQMKDVPEGFTKADVKEEMDAIEMAKLSKAELSDISKGRSKRAMAAADELDRRQMNKDVKSGRESGPYADKIPPITPEDHRQWKKQVSGNTLTKKQEKAADKEAYASAMGKEKPAAKKGKMTEKEKKEMQESLDFKKGGMVTKKKAPAKAKAPATASRSHPLNKFYGK